MRETEKGSVMVWKGRGDGVELCDRGGERDEDERGGDRSERELGMCKNRRTNTTIVGPIILRIQAS